MQSISPDDWLPPFAPPRPLQPMRLEAPIPLNGGRRWWSWAFMVLVALGTAVYVLWPEGKILRLPSHWRLPSSLRLPSSQDLRHLAAVGQARLGKLAPRRSAGRSLFAAGRRAAGLRAYDRALKADAGAADGSMLDDLAACFGRAEQGTAANLIVRHKLLGMADRLHALAQSQRSAVRWQALDVLKRLERASDRDYENVWIADLTLPGCSERRTALAGLARLGGPRAIPAIKAAKRLDDARTPWYRKSCLGSGAAAAIAQIDKRAH